jgi:hypothetical protein
LHTPDPLVAERVVAGRARPSRRTVLAGLSAALALPHAAAAAPATSAAATSGGGWELGLQILAGTPLRDPQFLAMALDTVAAEVGAPTLDALLDAVVGRDAANIADPFPDPAVEHAARRLVDVVYTGEVATPDGTGAIGFHQALAWRVLHFAKPPSVCGPGFGWWADAPEAS